MRLNGAEIVFNYLKENNVDTVFGYPGGAVVPLYDELYKMNGEINHVRCAHEQGCVHAADGYARSTGKVGVCFVTSGPGATNAVTGIAAAYMDSVPLVVISGQVATSLLGRDSFQEIDITGVTMTLTKHNYLVKDIKKLPYIMKEAFEVAKNGRPGPVLIDIPKNIFFEEVEIKDNQIYYEQSITNNVDDMDIDEVVKIINSSKKPVIYAGGGVIISQASKELIKLVNKSGIPVVNTLMGIGSYPRDNELSLGMAGMHGSREVNLAVKNSDLIIGIGTRFSDRGIGKSEDYSNTKIIHIDIDNTEINKNMKCDISLIGDMRDILTKLSDRIKFKNRNNWICEIKKWAIDDKVKDTQFVAKNILNKIQEYYKNDTIVTTDVGQHQMWVAQYWKFSNPRTFLTSGGLGAMGYGLGAALGAKLGNPNKDVVLVTGDGSFRMNCNEMSTATKYDLPIVIIMLNNNSLGLVRQLQKHFAGSRYSQTDMTEDVDYMMLSQAYGFKGYQVSDMSGLEKALNDIAVLNKKAVVIECLIDKEDLVLPIVPPGKTINNQIIE